MKISIDDPLVFIIILLTNLINSFVNSREKNMAVFDHYGRVLKYGQEPKEAKCTTTKNGNPKCKVTEHERRKYRTADEEKRQKMIQL